MTTLGTRRRRRSLGALVAGATTLTFVAAPGAIAASRPSALSAVTPSTHLALPGDATTPTASLALSGTSPGTLTAGDSLTLSVTVRNPGATTLSGRTLDVGIGRTALDTATKQSRWSAGTLALTRPVTASASVPDIAAGASATVTVTVPASKLDLPYAMTSLPLRVALSGADAPVLRSFVTWTSASSTFTQMKTSIVVPVTLPNDPKLLTATGAERFAAWNKAIGPGSPIAKLLTSNPSVPVTWLIDPAVLDPAGAQDGSLPTEAAGDDATATQTPSSSASAPAGAPSSGAPSSSDSPTGATSSAAGTPTSSSGGSPSSPAGSSTSAAPSATSPSSTSPSGSSSTTPATATTVEQLAADLVDTLTHRPSTQQVVFTPYGDPDLSALTADDRPAGSDALLRRSLARPLADELTKISETVVAAPTAPLDAASLARLTATWKAARGGTPLVLTPNVTLDGSDDVSVSSAARHTTSGVPMIGYSSALSRALSGDGATGDIDAGLRERAASLALYQQLPSATRSLVVMGDRLAPTSPNRLNQIGTALASSPWAAVSTLDVSPSRTSGPLARLSSKAPASTDVWPRPGTRAVDASDVATASSTLASLTRMAGAVTNGGDIVPAWTRNLDQAGSTRWRGDPAAVDALVGHARTTVDAIPARVHVVPARINFFSDSGSISVTVKNELARDVKDVRLALTPRTFAVQFPTQPEPVTLKASGQNTFRVPMTAQAAGRVSVDARLTAPGGVELGARGAGEREASPLEVNARPTGTWIFWVLGIVALLVFCYGLVRNRQKGTRRRDELARDIQL